MSAADVYADTLIAGASNLTFGDNPPYSIADFTAVYPQFGTYSTPEGDESPVWTGIVPEAVMQMYVNLASACIRQERWQESWVIGMALFIAHFAMLYVQSAAAAGSTAGIVAQKGAAKGVQVSKSVGDVSVSYQSVVSDIHGWAAWKLTSFGQQLMTMGRLMGLGGMYVY